MIELFDSHCHLTDAAFRDDREAVLHRAREAGVTRLVTIASSVDEALEAAALARAHEGVWCTAGVHPHEAGQAAPDAEARLRELAASPEVVALGETGLDYHYDRAPRPVQRRHRAVPGRSSGHAENRLLRNDAGPGDQSEGAERGGRGGAGG